MKVQDAMDVALTVSLHFCFWVVLLEHLGHWYLFFPHRSFWPQLSM